jgi:protein-L-isoaspartate O-methyltransferase
MDGDLYRAPLNMKKVKRVLDVGTGTGTHQGYAKLE